MHNTEMMGSTVNIIILINKQINQKCLGFLSSAVLHPNAYAL